MNEKPLLGGRMLAHVVLASTTILYGGELAAAPTIPQTPSALIGTWDVTEVLIDTKDQPHSPHFRNDLHLLGRELVIDAQRMRMNYGDGNCVAKRWRSQRTTWAKLIARSQLRNPGDRIRPEDYELMVTASDRVRVFHPDCSNIGRTQPNHSPWYDSTWLALRKKDSLVMNLGFQILLVLSRREESAKPDPSFPCETAQSDAEKTICSSVALSSLDRNLYKIWKIRGRNRYKEKLGMYTKEDVEDMNKYVEERNSCGTNVECIEEKIQSYLDGMLYL